MMRIERKSQDNRKLTVKRLQEYNGVKFPAHRAGLAGHAPARGDALIDDATKERTDCPFGLSRVRVAEKTKEEEHEPIE
jgi:hypothetical protein